MTITNKKLKLHNVGKNSLFINNIVSDDIEKEYMSLIKEIQNKNLNKGEKNEIILLINIFYWNITKNYSELIKIFGDMAEEGVTLFDISEGTIIDNINNIKKSQGLFKADCIMKFNKTNEIVYSSIKTKIGGNPSIMNHQRRDQKVFQLGGDLHYLLNDIDNLVSKYHCLRKEGLPEEINFNNLSNFSEKDKEVLLELIWYFMFVGSGNNCSKQQANGLIIIHKNDIVFFNLKKKENQLNYIKDNWELFNISLISRKNLSGLKFKDEIENKCLHDTKFKQKYDIMKPWIYETDDKGKNNPLNKIKLKTALHIRMK